MDVSWSNPISYCSQEWFFRRFDHNQSFGHYFSLFEVHITPRFKSDVSSFIDYQKMENNNEK